MLSFESWLICSLMDRITFTLLSCSIQASTSCLSPIKWSSKRRIYVSLDTTNILLYVLVTASHACNMRYVSASSWFPHQCTIYPCTVDSALYCSSNPPPMTSPHPLGWSLPYFNILIMPEKVSQVGLVFI